MGVVRVVLLVFKHTYDRNTQKRGQKKLIFKRPLLIIKNNSVEKCRENWVQIEKQCYKVSRCVGKSIVHAYKPDARGEESVPDELFLVRVCFEGIYLMAKTFIRVKWQAY